MTGALTYRRAALAGLYAAAASVVPRTVGAAMALPLIALPAGWWLLLKPHRWAAVFLAAAILLPPLPGDIGNAGPHPSLLIAAAGLAIGLARLRQWTLPFDPLGRALAALFTVMLASVPAALLYSGPAIAAASFARVALFGISVYLYLYFVHGPAARAPLHLGRWLRLLVAAAVIAAAFACADFYFQLPAPAGFAPQFVWMSDAVVRRAQGLFYEASTLGNFCSMFLVLLAVIATTPRHARLIRPVYLAAAGAVLFTALVLSYSRASIVALAAALAALFYLRGGRYRWQRWIPILAVSALAGAAAIYWLAPSYSQSYWMRINNSFQFFVVEPNATLSGRLASWTTVFRLLLDHPAYLLLGVGYKTLPYSEIAGANLTVDNMYLSLLVETGLPGLLALLYLHRAALRTAYAAAIRPEPAPALFGAWMFCFWIGEIVQMLSGDLLTYWRVLPIYFWAFAMCRRLSTLDEDSLR